MIHHVIPFLFDGSQYLFGYKKFPITGAKIKAGLCGTMEIGASADAQVIFFRKSTDLSFIRRRMGRINGFNSHQSDLF